jgi:hypothetical protein
MAALVAEVSASRQTIERQAGEIADLREERGRHTAELERAASAIVALGEEVETLRASHTQQASNPGPAVPAPSTDAPVQHQINPGALLPWVLTVLAVVGGGRAAVADVSAEILGVGAVIIAVMAVGYVVRRRRRQLIGEGSGGGP